MIKTALASLLVAVAALTPACATSAVGCDFRDDEARCQERRGLQANGFDAVCSGLGATSVPDGCPTDGIVGGCELNADVTDWYYAPTTPEEIADDCDGEGTVVDAP